jgi:uncharacterized protein (DUF433 family)
MRKLAGRFSVEKLMESYPHLSKEQMLAAFEYAADLIKFCCSKKIISPSPQKLSTDYHPARGR